MKAYRCNHMPLCGSKSFTEGNVYKVVKETKYIAVILDDFGYERFLSVSEKEPTFIVRNDGYAGPVYRAVFSLIDTEMLT